MKYLSTAKGIALIPNLIFSSPDPDQECVLIKLALILISCKIHNIQFLGQRHSAFSPQI